MLRSLQNFRIGTERMPLSLIHAFALLKKAAAQVNQRTGHLKSEICQAIIQAADEVSQGLLSMSHTIR